MNPEQVKFSNSPVEATAAESELVIFRAELSEYNPSSNKFVRINLPVADKAWIDWSDSVLSLKFTNRSYDTVAASASESAVRTSLSNLIKSVSILNSNGEQIEYINNYNLINNIISDYTMATTHKKNVEQILAGGSPDGNPANGEEINGVSTGVVEADGSSEVFVDKLMTGFTSGQFLTPMGYLVGQACSIVLELEDPDTALRVNTAANHVNAYKVSEVQIRAKQIRFNSQFNMAFEETLAEAGDAGVNYISETFLHNQGSIASGTSGLTTVNFSTNPRSAKYILACLRTEAHVTDIDGYSLDTRSSGCLIEYSWEIAGKVYPTQPIQVSDTNKSQAMAQVLDAMGMVGALNSATLVTLKDTNNKFYDNTQATAQKFVAALVLEDFNSATNASTYSGANLSTVSTMAFRPKLGDGGSGASSASTNYRVDLFTSCDISYHFTLAGQCYSIR